MSSSNLLDASSSSVASAHESGLHMRFETLIEAELPTELRPTAKGLLRAVISKVAVPGHFDAFCCQAFSKPEWAAASSPLIAEMFEEDEDQLAELARIPDLVIEMGSGQVNVTCMVASRWAARGETHRLSRLADAIVASHACKNVCAVEVMLALAATLAVTRFSRAEQLYNAALPLANDEHQEALADARRWLAAGRVVCSALQDERDFWDVRLRKPKAAWPWQSKAEREALDHLSERLTTDMEGADLFRAVLPEIWWDLAMKCAQQQEKIALEAKKLEAAKMEAGTPPRASLLESVPPPERIIREVPPHLKAGQFARFVLGWVCGCIAMALTVLALPSELVNRLLGTPRASSVNASSSPTPAEMEAWRKETLQKKAAELAQFEPQHALAKNGSWQENEQLLSGHSQELPYDSPQYMNLLVWLHLDPPKDKEVRLRISKLLLERVKGSAISLWEMLIYPGSPNAEEIKTAARSALADAAFQWNTEEKMRLGLIAGTEAPSKDLPATGHRK